MTFPISTGQAARLLNRTEPQLADAVRRGKISPEPPIIAGRRLWMPEALAQAADHFDIPREVIDRYSEVIEGDEGGKL